MKVKELIEKLQRVDQEAIVYISPTSEIPFKGLDYAGEMKVKDVWLVKVPRLKEKWLYIGVIDEKLEMGVDENTKTLDEILNEYDAYRI